MIKPRNTLVVVRLIENKDKQVGNITVPANADLYCEAEVMAVGPGISSVGRTETFDLAVGQRVLVKHKQHGRGGPLAPSELAGIRYLCDGEVLYVFEQGSIVGIVAQPGEAPATEPETSGKKLLQSN